MEGQGPHAHPPLPRSHRSREQELASVVRPEVGIQCAKDEGKPLLGIWAYTTDRTNLAGVRTVPWTDANIAGFIDSL